MRTRLHAISIASVWMMFLANDAAAYLNPEEGRWLSRDPIEEQGGLNLYGFVQNDPNSRIDRNGLDSLGLWDRPPNTDVLGNPLPGHPRYAEYRLETALAFHVTAAIGAHATWDGAMRSMYHAADEKLVSGIRQLVAEGIITQEQGARLYIEKVNKLVIEFRDKSSPVGRFVAEHLKSRNNLPTPERILAKKSAEQVLSRAHANEQVGRTMQKVGKLGRACTVLSIGIGVYTVSTAEPNQRARVTTRVVGEFGGSIGGAWAGGAAGGAIGGANWGSRGGIWGSVIGTVSGAVLGGAAGGEIAETTYDVFVDQ